MKRLTERFSNGQACVYGCGDNCKYDYKYCNNYLEDCPTINEIYEKLASYEELEEQLENIYGECDGLLETIVNSLVKHEDVEIGTPRKARLLTDEDVDKWESFKDAEEQGLLLRLPCKIGDVVYILTPKKNDYIETDVKRIVVYDNDIEIVTCICVRNIEEIGKTVFFTKEEAEQALAKMKEV